MNANTHRLPGIIITALVSIALFGCAELQVQTQQESSVQAGKSATLQLGPVQQERDEIYMLLAYSVVLKNWQTDETRPQRGHNIGSVLVDPDGKIVFWARNSNHITGNGTQHGEVRLIRNRLAQTRSYNLKDHTVYTSLEPCAMCSGMMVLTNVSRTVYGQTDPGFGKALERLALDSRKLPDGHGPYPRKVISQASNSLIRERLDAAYAKYQAGGGGSLTKWLRSADAKAIYEDALRSFQAYRVRYPDNQQVLDEALAYYKIVPDHYVELKH